MQDEEGKVVATGVLDHVSPNVQLEEASSTDEPVSLPASPMGSPPRSPQRDACFEVQDDESATSDDLRDQHPDHGIKDAASQLEVIQRLQFGRSSTCSGEDASESERERELVERQGEAALWDNTTPGAMPATGTQDSPCAPHAVSGDQVPTGTNGRNSVESGRSFLKSTVSERVEQPNDDRAYAQAPVISSACPEVVAQGHAHGETQSGPPFAGSTRKRKQQAAKSASPASTHVQGNVATGGGGVVDDLVKEGPREDVHVAARSSPDAAESGIPGPDHGDPAQPHYSGTIQGPLGTPHNGHTGGLILARLGVRMAHMAKGCNMRRLIPSLYSKRQPSRYRRQHR